MKLILVLQILFIAHVFSVTEEESKEYIETSKHFWEKTMPGWIRHKNRDQIAKHYNHIDFVTVPFTDCLERRHNATTMIDQFFLAGQFEEVKFVETMTAKLRKKGKWYDVLRTSVRTKDSKVHIFTSCANRTVPLVMYDFVIFCDNRRNQVES